MKRFIFGAVAAFAALGLSACGSAGAGSCTIDVSAANYSYCINYTGSAYTVDSVKAACSSGTYSADACATSSGKKCVFQKGTSSEYSWAFTVSGDAGSFDPESTCTTAGGTYE